MSTTDDTHARKAILNLVEAMRIISRSVHSAGHFEVQPFLDEAERQAKLIDAVRGQPKEEEETTE